MLHALLDDQIWEAHHWIKMPPPGVFLDCRMTLLRLSDGSLLIHSATPIEDALHEAIRAQGDVSAIIAPSLYHHMYAKQAAARFPNAVLYGARGLAKKRPDIDFDHTLLEGDAAPWQQDLTPIFVAGAPAMNETLFYHAASRSLLVTDLVFNMHTFRGAMSPWVFRGMGTHKRFAQSRLWRVAIKDRAAYSASLRALFELDIQRLIMAHGEVIEGADTGERLRAVLAPLMS